MLLDNELKSVSNQNEDRIVKISKTMKDKYNKGLITNGMLGKKHPKEIKELISNSAKEMWKNKDIRKNIIEAITGRKRTSEQKSNYSLSKIGEKNPSWKGGVSFELYGSEFNDKLRLAIRRRDCFTCQECYISEEEVGFILDIHHLDYNKKNNNPSNLISLCRYCHMETNFNRDFWRRWFHILKNKEVLK